MKDLLIAIINNNVVKNEIHIIMVTIYYHNVVVEKNDLRFIVFICVPLQ